MTLRELRIAANLLQETVAKKMNVSQGAVSKWETGDTKPPRKHRKKLAKLYKCSQEDISMAIAVGDPENPSQPGN